MNLIQAKSLALSPDSTTPTSFPDLSFEMTSHSDVTDGASGTDDSTDVTESPEDDVSSDSALHDLVNGIFPGTKWCGFGNIADDIYHELGKFSFPN